MVTTPPNLRCRLLQDADRCLNFGRPRRAGGEFASRHERGSMLAELIVAIGIVAVTVLPLAYSVSHEHQFLRGCYNRAVAMEIVDGEMEVLAAGEWHAFKEGTQPYPVQAGSLTNLWPGQFQLTVTGKRLRLEWLPEDKDRGGKVAREATVR
jgi:hypothetical protein